MSNTEQLFPVLSSAKVKRPTETDRKLPGWLSNPTQFPAVNLLDSGLDVDEFSHLIDNELMLYLKRNMLVDRFFPVQKCLIPVLTKQFESRSFRRPNDICVSSPTGSGKTLAFAIPIVNYLKKTLHRSFRALVVLPSRDLAQQVHKTFQQLCSTTHLKCVLAASEGTDSNKGLLRQEQQSRENHDIDCPITKQISMLQNFHPVETNIMNTIDILVSTPGVLVDLIHNSIGLSFKDLEILVIDEADRLMTSHKHDWLNTVERAIVSHNVDCPCKLSLNLKRELSQSADKRQRVCFSSNTGCAIKHANDSKPLHKLLFSATLSSDPQLLMYMNLFQPRLFLATKPSITGTKIRNSLGGQPNVSSPGSINTSTVNLRSELLTCTAIPEQLEEKMFITETKEKLFVMWYLLHELKYTKVICFANQLPTSFRLCKFINEIDGVRAVEFSSNLKPETRQKLLNEFKLNRIEVIVCTDLMARGMDVEGVDYVISYDMPSSEIFYVHRVGRTARAGNKGTAITLVDTKQLVQFKKIVQLAHKEPNSMRLSDVVEEMKVPHSVKKNANIYDLYTKTLENYEDKLKMLAKKSKFHHKKE